jgi:zinc D-Ala-D-Ala carboxypeptidase|tara:strand:- start:12463 stop:12945 length:483 start_codon:yes stop_codon:yes gene_type:complete
MNLSRNFTLSELIKSDTAIRKGIDNNPNAEQIDKLKMLCEKILQPVRDHFGRVKVTSGYRSPELCVAIGSSLTSQHSKAEAVDFECVGVDNAEVADWVKMNCETDQLILEYYTPGEPNSGWIHASYIPFQPRAQYMRAFRDPESKKTKYLPITSKAVDLV